MATIAEAKTRTNEQPSKASLYDRLALSWRLPLLLFRVLTDTLTWLAARKPFKDGRVEPVTRLFTLSIFRNIWKTLGHDTFISLTEPASLAIEKYAKKNNLKYEAVLVDSGVSNVPPATLNFVDCTADVKGPLFFFIHGGGYAWPLDVSSHLPFTLRGSKIANASPVLLEYTLAPAVKYPGQLIQAVAALKYLLSSGRRPEEIIIAGESAGAHLILSLLAHLAQPSPYTPALKEFSGPNPAQLKAALLASPWVGFDYMSPSFKSNSPKDALRVNALRFFEDFFAPKKDEVWANHLLYATNNEGFWKRALGQSNKDGVVQRSLILAGENEVLLDDIVAFANGAGAVSKGATGFGDDKPGLIVAEGDAHAALLLDVLVNFPGTMLTESLEWLEAVKF